MKSGRDGDAIERIVYAVTDQDQVRRHPILVFMGVRSAHVRVRCRRASAATATHFSRMKKTRMPTANGKPDLTRVFGACQAYRLGQERRGAQRRAAHRSAKLTKCGERGRPRTLRGQQKESGEQYAQHAAGGGGKRIHANVDMGESLARFLVKAFGAPILARAVRAPAR